MNARWSMIRCPWKVWFGFGDRVDNDNLNHGENEGLQWPLGGSLMRECGDGGGGGGLEERRKGRREAFI